MLEKYKLYFNTIKYLKPIQLWYQLKKTLFPKYLPKVEPNNKKNNIKPLNTMIPELDLDDQYVKRFWVDKIMEGQIILLNEGWTINRSNWSNPNASHLWNFNLHYFEYGIALAATYYKTKDLKYYQKFKELLTSWIDANQQIKGDAWHPYTISLRLPNLFICFDLFGEPFQNDTEFQQKVTESLYKQYRWLLQRQELHQLGNHYFENLKTIVFGSLIFNDLDIFKKYFKKLCREIEEEILPDGVHFELSIMYHKIIFDAMLRIAFWLKQRDPEKLQLIFNKIQKMLDALVSLEKGMGKTPFFNDGADGVAKDATQLISAAKRLFGLVPKLQEDLIDSGYYKLYSDDIAVMFDAGKIGPDYMPGHSHCDALSLEISKGKVPVFVNSGVYQYQGNLRKYFRSTEAHNTVLIDGRQQSEFWGEHRVARRISNVVAKRKANRIIGSYRNYCGAAHTRQIGFIGNALVVIDRITTSAPVLIRSFLHIAPPFGVVNEEECFCVKEDTKLICSIYPLQVSRTIIHNEGEVTNYAPQFGMLQRATVIEFQFLSTVKYSGYYIVFTNKIALSDLKNCLEAWLINLDEEGIIKK
jgi:uncharacterized heparinase superfamily protein